MSLVKATDKELAWAEQDNHHMITIHDPRYPARLKEIASAPPVLYVHGNIDLLKLDQIAIVGSRNPTPTGLENAAQFARHLAEAGFIITSGLALGIDGASHRGALEANKPTIAVLGTGIDQIYPARHRQLAIEIAKNGALVSEFPLGTSSHPSNFPRRNRIISGLSLGVLVVEAALKSGSLITARKALEQSREVFAIPGSIHNPLARGNHALIRQGAKLVETVQDIVEELGIIKYTERKSPKKKQMKDFLDKDYQKLVKCIDHDGVTVDSLATRSGFPASRVSSILTMLELKGYMTCENGKYFTR